MRLGMAGRCENADLGNVKQQILSKSTKQPVAESVGELTAE
jgi:hypothetical protein